MVKGLLQQENKKGVSLMVGYVLLIVIAIGLSVAVFAYLKLYLPKDQPKCHDDVILSIADASCVNDVVNITLTNRGFFNINGAFIRIGDQGRVFKTLLNDDETQFLFIGDPNNDGLLNPGESWSKNYAYTSTGPQELEIEPFLYIDGKPALCEKAVVSKIVNC